MGEIKFQAWDIKDKKMYGCDSLCRLHFDDGVPYCFYTWEDVMILGKNLELMQYTGLKDKNGKEIYRGYIVRLGDGSTYEVIFAEGGFKLQGIGKDKSQEWDLYIDEAVNPEIIGNIYENPELL